MARKASAKEVKDEPVKESKALSPFELAVAELNKKYGAGSISSGNSVPELLEVVDTGSLFLNAALECGGWPVGKMIEVQGPESSSKTTLTLHAIANFQQRFPDKKVLLIDFEHAFDSAYARNLGVDVDALVIFQPSCSEEGYNTIVMLIRTGAISLVVIDSHTAGTPKAIVDGEVGQHTIGLDARINGVAVAKIKPMLKPFNCTLLAISQQRTKFGQFTTSQASTGGNAWKFYSDIRIKTFRVIDKDKGIDKTTMEVIKNKCGRPFNKAELSVVWGKGIDRKGEVVKTAIASNDIIAAGSWFTLAPDVKIQGMEKVMAFMEDNPEFFQALEDKVLGKIQLERGDENSTD